MSLNWADWIIIAIVAVSCGFGLMRGLIKEALSVANWLIALLIALTFKESFALLLVDKIQTPSLRELTAFGALFLATLLVGALVNYLVGELVKVTGLSSTDRTLGMVFGLLRGFVVVMAMLLLVPSVLSVNQDPWWAESALIPHFLAFEDWARATARQIVTWVIQLFSNV